MLFKNVGVDAGIIMIADEDFFKKYSSYKFDTRLSKFTTLEKGKYAVEWSIKNIYNGPVQGKGILEVTSGRVIVSDPCYLIDDHDEWTKILDTYNFLTSANPPEGTLVLDEMGGDGDYNVSVRFFKK